MPANASFDEIVTTTIKNRSRELADNVTNHIPLLSRLNQRGNIMLEDGGETIVKELDYAENSTFLYYTGYEQISTVESDVLSAAEFAWKQAAVAVTMSGLQQRQNSGRERMINLLSGRINNAMRTMRNNLATGIASDGTGSSGKQITGLQSAVADSPATGTYGGINRANFTFWRNYSANPDTSDATTILSSMNTAWLNVVRNADYPDLIAAGSTAFDAFWQTQQSIQRITGADSATSGFRSLKYAGPGGDADVIYDSTLLATRMYFLNTDYLSWVAHPAANMTTLDRRQSVNQDAMVVPIIWQGNLVCSNCSLQGVLY